MKKKKNQGKARNRPASQVLGNYMHELNLNELSVSEIKDVLGGTNVIIGVSHYWNSLTTYQTHALLGTLALGAFAVVGIIASHGRGEANAHPKVTTDLEMGPTGKPERNYTVTDHGKNNGVFFDEKGETYAQDSKDHHIIYNKNGDIVPNDVKILAKHPTGGLLVNARLGSIRRTFYADSLQKMAKKTIGGFVDAETGQVYYRRAVESEGQSKFAVYNMKGELIKHEAVLKPEDTFARGINSGEVELRLPIDRSEGSGNLEE